MENIKEFNYLNMDGKCQEKEWTIWEQNIHISLWSINICSDILFIFIYFIYSYIYIDIEEVYIILIIIL